MTVFGATELAPVELDGLTVWGVSWGATPLTARFLDSFRAPDDGQTHVLLLHGTCPPGHLGEGHCPFEAARVRAAGFAACLAGHIHAASVRDGVVYPGSPEPLGWGETGRHCVAIVDVDRGNAEVELIDVNQARYESVSVDVDGAASSAAVASLVAPQLDIADRERVFLKVELRGEVEPEAVVDVNSLSSELGDGFAGLRIEDRSKPAYDLDALAQETGARGEFVRRMRERIGAAPAERDRDVAEKALVMGLRALDGRADVLDVG